MPPLPAAIYRNVKDPVPKRIMTLGTAPLGTAPLVIRQVARSASAQAPSPFIGQEAYCPTFMALASEPPMISAWSSGARPPTTSE